MRILVDLVSVKNCEYMVSYFHKLQGFIYKLLLDSPYRILHDKKGYKFFCFSNIFPLRINNGRIPPIKEGERRKFLISSPDRVLIKFVEKKLKELKNDNKVIHIGDMSFRIENFSVFNVKLRKNCKLISATPIIIRIPERNYEKYGIPPEYRKRRYVYWRPCYSFEAFVKQLEENLLKKYNEFYKTDLKTEKIFEMFKFIKGPVINHVVINGKEQKFVGSLWEFAFTYLTRQQKKLLEFGIDCGFGERNSLGFGFINPKR